MHLPVITVKQLNSYVKSLLESDRHLSSFYLKGEISNFKDHYQSGHLYFSLKDSDAVIRAVMFRSSASYLKFKPQDGMSVICRGRVSLYERDGSYQFYAEEMIPDGVGDLTVAFEQIKKKLGALGYFDEEYKKSIPRFPNKIAVITSDTGAAVQDILNITNRRYPLCEIVMCPVRVQGDGAVPELIDALRRVQQISSVDTIIIGRGGGSIEDLWAFNSEELAHEIFKCNIPVISAVGHETDFTICDFVSDLRAPTPSAAAELAVPDAASLKNEINSLLKRIKNKVELQTQNAEKILKYSGKDALYKALCTYISDCSQRVDIAYDKLLNSYRNHINKIDNNFRENVAKLNALSPLSVLSRGYSVVKKQEKTVKCAELSVGDNINVRFSDGYAECTVDFVERKTLND